MATVDDEEEEEDDEEDGEEADDEEEEEVLATAFPKCAFLKACKASSGFSLSDPTVALHSLPLAPCLPFSRVSGGSSCPWALQEEHTKQYS
jgi:hypothetical protein